MKIKFDGLDNLLNKIEKMEHEIPQKAKTWVDALGMEFLDLVQKEIIRVQSVDTRLLLNSFSKGDKSNIWQLSDGGLTLEVGTSLDYAKWVDEGHNTVNPDTPGAFTMKDGRLARFVPGSWVGQRFEYNPRAKGGMILVAQFVPGSDFFKTANKMFKVLFRRSIDKKFKDYMKHI